MERHEIAVVGAGPSGSTAAYFLARKNFDVVLIEKNVFPRDKPCGGGLTMKTVNFLKKFGLYDDSYIEKKIDVIKLTHVKGLETTIEVPNVIETVRRRFFDQYLARRAVDAGALFFENEPLIKMEKKNGYFELKTRQKRFKADFVIGADGVAGRVAALAKLKNGRTKDKLILAAVAEMPCKQGPEYVELRLGYLRYGYGWIFPKNGYINVGIGCKLSSCREFRISLKKFLQYIKNKFGVKAGRMLKYWCIPVGGSQALEKEQVILVGDAAGLGDPWSGEGIYQALVSGWMGAFSASAVLNGGSSRYTGMIKKVMLQNLKIGDLFSKLYYSFQYYDVKFAGEHKSFVEQYLELLLKNKIGYVHILKAGIPFLFKLLTRHGFFLFKRI